jgi:TonB family protein
MVTSSSTSSTISQAGSSAVILFALIVLGLFISFTSSATNASPQTPVPPVCVSVLDFGDSPIGRLAADQLAANLKRDPGLSLMDRDLARAAARGSSYSGSLNISRGEARNLGAAIGCDYYVLGDAQTLRRSPSTGPIYFESYASVFLVSSRTGKLVSWERPNFRAENALAAEKELLAELSGIGVKERLAAAIRTAQKDRRADLELTSEVQLPIIEAAPDDEKLAESEGLRLPRPFRRLTPAYPSSAAQAEAEAMVDVLVDLDVRGEVMRVEIDRWAGFGLDESTVETVRQLHFFPAMRNGVAVPMRILLRYNFRKPPR